MCAPPFFRGTPPHCNLRSLVRASKNSAIVSKHEKSNHVLTAQMGRNVYLRQPDFHSTQPKTRWSVPELTSYLCVTPPVIFPRSWNSSQPHFHALPSADVIKF